MKKIISIFLILLMMLGIIIYPRTANASFSMNSADLYSKGLYEGYLKYKNSGIIFNYVVYEKSGKEYPAYCLNKDLDGVTANVTYSVTTDELLTNVKVWRAIINGYPYKTANELGCESNEEAFIATKQAVYCMLYDRDINEYSAEDERQQRVLNALTKIVENARNSSQIKQSSNLNIVEVTDKWTQDSQDKKYVSKTFTASANAPINRYKVYMENMKIDGAKVTNEKNEVQEEFKYKENFKILIPIKSMQESGTFNIKVEGQVATKPVLYGYSTDRNLQDYAITGLIYEDGHGEKTIQYLKNETKLRILKQDEDGNNLEGVKFNLMDKGKNILFSDLTTNKKGEINILNMEPGIYFVEETSTLSGYATYDELIETNVKYNEQVTVKVTNSKEKVEIEEPIKTQSEINVVSKLPEPPKLPKTGM